MPTMLLESTPTKREGDTVWIETGPYKNAIATIKRLTAKKMEVYLHDGRYHGSTVMINQASGRITARQDTDGRPIAVDDPHRSAQRASPRTARPKAKMRSERTQEPNAQAMCDVLQAEIDQMQAKLDMMKIVVGHIKHTQHKQQANSAPQGQRG